MKFVLSFLITAIALLPAMHFMITGAKALGFGNTLQVIIPVLAITWYNAIQAIAERVKK